MASGPQLAHGALGKSKVAELTSVEFLKAIIHEHATIVLVGKYVHDVLQEFYAFPLRQTNVDRISESKQLNGKFVLLNTKRQGGRASMYEPQGNKLSITIEAQRNTLRTDGSVQVINHAKRQHSSEPLTASGLDDEDTNKPSATRNPIYLFYETVLKNALGSSGTPGDKHYKCFHGNRQIITISKAARSNLGKLIRHLKNNFPVMYRLYCALHTQTHTPTEEQVSFAQGTVPLDGAGAKEYLGKVEMATSNIIKGLEQQARKAQVFFNQILVSYSSQCSSLRPLYAIELFPMCCVPAWQDSLDSGKP
ncbi:hypothetical protein B0H10DRAFT_1957410 [Mycena sp. CBHHK59/15]|nr:hypothetical protein B0H10DRAFT_1957410 [Mycena sp. CBHHK59/15]